MVAVADFSQISAGLISVSPEDVKSKRTVGRTRIGAVIFLAAAGAASSLLPFKTWKKQGVGVRNFRTPTPQVR